MKRSELYFNLISIPMDIAALATAGIVSFYLRTHTQQIVGKVLFELHLSDFIAVLVKVIPILLLVFALLGLYNLRGTRRFIHEFNRIFIGTSLGMLFALVLFFFNQSIFPSRFIILSAWVLSIVFVFIGRWILKTIQEYFFAKGYGLHSLVIINGSGIEAELIESMLKDRSFGYNVVAELSNTETLLADLEKLYSETQIDEIMQANPHVSDQQNLQLVEFARNKGLQFSFVPNLFEVQRNVIELNNFQGLPVISLKNTPLDGWGKVAKRVLDVITSLICLVITAPIFLFIYIAVKFDSEGPVIYRQMRGGYKKDFEFYKFRSMYYHLSTGVGNEEAEKLRLELWAKNTRGGGESPFLKMKNDPRITRVGRIIRRTKLDELPQFWNVLRGEMSMVGPRAHMLEEVERYRSRYLRMFSIKPGIFGISQLAQITWPDLPFEEEIRLNTYYIENWSLWWDIKILIKSAWMLFFARKPKDDY